MKKIKLHDKCLGCNDIGTGFKYTCRDCTNLLPRGFYSNEEYKEVIPYHIPREQRDEFLARYIIRYFKDLNNWEKYENNNNR